MKGAVWLFIVSGMQKSFRRGPFGAVWRIDVRKRRHAVGLSQAAFATACNVPLRTFKRFEAGNCDSMLVLIKILQVFGRFDGFDLLFEEVTPPMEARTLLAVEAKLQAKVRASKLKPK